MTPSLLQDRTDGPSVEAECLRVIDGLRQVPPRLSPKWLYDSVGSALFEAITRLAEYRVTRADMALLERLGPEIAAALPAQAAVVELGIGSPAKARLLLAAMDRPARFVGVDVSEVALKQAVQSLSEALPTLPIEGWQLDFTRPAELRRKINALADQGPIVLFFPGSTIGNFEREAAVHFLGGLAREMPVGTSLVLGVDLIKPKDDLLLAYDDPAGVTAAFNRNALAHLNHRCGSNFNPRAWRHEARWSDANKRVEMWLVAQGEQRVQLGGVQFVFPDGAGIHTESSHKFNEGLVREMATAAGWQLSGWWHDTKGGFAQVLLKTTQADPV